MASMRGLQPGLLPPSYMHSKRCLVGHALDDLDAVVDAFKDARIHWEDGGGEDAPQVFSESAGKQDDRWQSALNSHPIQSWGVQGYLVSPDSEGFGN